MIQREDRMENVERIGRANQHHQQKIMKKIQEDNLRGEALQMEKNALLETRFAVRRQAEQQKTVLMKTVEQMKKKGNFDKNELAKMGINVSSNADSEEHDGDVSQMTQGEISSKLNSKRDIHTVKQAQKMQM